MATVRIPVSFYYARWLVREASASTGFGVPIEVNWTNLRVAVANACRVVIQETMGAIAVGIVFAGTDICVEVLAFRASKSVKFKSAAASSYIPVLIGSATWQVIVASAWIYANAFFCDVVEE